MEDITDEAAARPPSLTPEQLRVLIFEALTRINSVESLQILEHVVKAMPK